MLDKSVSIDNNYNTANIHYYLSSFMFRLHVVVSVVNTDLCRYGNRNLLEIIGFKKTHEYINPSYLQTWLLPRRTTLLLGYLKFTFMLLLPTLFGWSSQFF